jgi:hypothetical protein
MTTWLDTETRAMLQREPPKKLAPPDTATFALVLLAVPERGQTQLLKAIERATECSPQEALRILGRKPPLPLKAGLSHEDAMLGQFELVCCDAVSVFLADDILTHAARNYLPDLYEQLLKSPEFEPVSVLVESVPANPRGEKFLGQFLDRTECAFPIKLQTLRKKARIMEHWAAKIGGRVTIVPE